MKSFQTAASQVRFQQHLFSEAEPSWIYSWRAGGLAGLASLPCLRDLRSTLLSPLRHRAAPGSSLETGAVVCFPSHSNQETVATERGAFA